jgi:polyhydroxyalkanoate synthesis regulator protein
MGGRPQSPGFDAAEFHLGPCHSDAVPDFQPTLVKRYGGGRLYDTTAGRYVTLDDLRRWQGEGVAFEVRDAETGADIGRVLLA